MKKILLSIICFLACVLSLSAQTLFGTTFNGGKDGGGTINKFIPATNTLIIAKSLEGLAAHAYYTNLIQASDGKLYGMTSEGGISDGGVIFSLDASTSAYTKLKNFENINGSKPFGSLMQASNGKLYGMTHEGGNSNAGVIFSFEPSTSTYTKIKDFDITNGGSPYGSLMQASDGKLYGMTNAGGNNGLGVVFSFDLLSSTYTKLKDFDDVNGASPTGNLIQATDGKLYGMTRRGGIYSANQYVSGLGVIFSFDPTVGTYAKLMDFNEEFGFPDGTLMQATDGNFYGMNKFGGLGYGSIFSFNPVSGIAKNLKLFQPDDGTHPHGDLLQLSDGKLYGMTTEGGSIGGGVIFSFDPVVSNFTKLKDFNYTDGGYYPYGNLMQASNGKLYGMTFKGGGGHSFDDIGNGVIFSFDPSNATYTINKDFGTNEEGSNISACLIKATNGKLYGMTTSGGKYGQGTIFSFELASSTFLKLWDFDRVKGGKPYGSLIQATNGKLYGVTSAGGRNDRGVVFSYDPAAATYSRLKDFDYVNGSYPQGSLVQAINGKLYGTAQGGRGHGVIFSFAPATNTFTIVKNFNLDLANGILPHGTLLQSSDGKLYGLTNGGGSNFGGVIFSLDPKTDIYTKLKDFNENASASFGGGLIQATDGKLYGMSSHGGIYMDGFIFSFAPSTSTFTTLKDFDNNSNPLGKLMQASDGKLYGMTYKGGMGYGDIFSFDPVSATYIKLQNFDNNNGANPYFGAGFIEVKDCISKTYYRDADGDGYGNPTCHGSACIQPAGYVSNNLDCDDNNKAVNAALTYYRDADQDGYGDENVSLESCAPPAGYVKNNFDCNDHKRAGNPRMERVKICRKGMPECVFVKDIFKMLCRGWTLGPCRQNCSNMASRSTIDNPDNLEKFSEEQAVSQQYKLSNYPNPFAGTSTIKYELPQDSKVSIKVYDVLGRTVTTLVDANKKAGTYTVIFNADHLSKGSFFYRMIATSKDNQFEQTNQMILFR